MPVYEFRCKAHGLFEVFRPMEQSAAPAYCPQCRAAAQRLFSLTAIRIVSSRHLQYGTGSPGRVILGSETGGMDIFIPSDGALEQEEVDYIAAGAVEKEKARVKRIRNKGPQRATQARIQAYSQLALRAKPGQRRRVLKEAIANQGDNLVNYRGK